MTSNNASTLLQNLSDERNAVHLYRTLASRERNPQIAEIFNRMADVEERHAATYIQRLENLGITIPVYKPTLRTRILEAIALRFGPEAVLPSLTAIERKVSQTMKLESSGSDIRLNEIAAEESSHARLLGHISLNANGGMEGSTLAQLEGRHRAGGGNALRAAVLGANDGLVSNLSLVMGVAGADLNAKTILITGLAGLLAGAFSMALGEWLSVQSSRELYQHQIEIETQEIENAPDEEAEELALIYQSRGISPEQAHQMANKIMTDRSSAIETLAREELSVNPKELGGSAWEAALTSFALFAFGAIIPVIPYIFFSGKSTVLYSILLSTVGLFIIGAGITLFTGRNVFTSGFRQVLFGLAAATITFALGKLIGTSLAG